MKKCIGFNENDTITHMKTGMNIPIQEFLRLIIVMNSNVKEYEVFFQLIINHIPNELIRNPKLIKLKEIQDIANIGEPFKWFLHHAYHNLIAKKMVNVLKIYNMFKPSFKEVFT